MARRPCRIGGYKQSKLLEMCVGGVPARRTVAELVEGEIELDESYFGGHRKGNRGRGAAGKIPVSAF